MCRDVRPSPSLSFPLLTFLCLFNAWRVWALGETVSQGPVVWWHLSREQHLRVRGPPCWQTSSPLNSATERCTCFRAGAPVRDTGTPFLPGSPCFWSCSLGGQAWEGKGEPRDPRAVTAGPPDRARAGAAASRRQCSFRWLWLSQALGPLVGGCPWTSPREASQIRYAEAQLWLCRQARQEAGQVDNINPSLSAWGRA